jgi:hypothetical protein
MGKRKWTPEERDAFRRRQAAWREHRREMEAMVERLHERWRLEDERRERRRRRLRRFLPTRRAA